MGYSFLLAARRTHPVCGMVHIKEPLQLIGKSSGSGFPLSLSEWSFTICPTPYNRKIKINKNVLSASLNKTFPSFLPCLYSLSYGVSCVSQFLQLLGEEGEVEGHAHRLSRLDHIVLPETRHRFKNTKYRQYLVCDTS